MGRFPIAAALALALSTPLRAGVEVTASGDRVDVTAAQAPLSEVLDNLARKTRMKVIYEGPVPRMPVTVELRGRTQAQAVLGVLEGLGLNYALLLDASGTAVETLLITGTGARMVSAASVRPARSSRRPHASPEDPTVESAEPPPEVEEGNAPTAVQDTPKADDNAAAAAAGGARPLPGPPVVGPLNPTNPFPNSPFPPGPRPLATPSPSPNPPPDH